MDFDTECASKIPRRHHDVSNTSHTHSAQTVDSSDMTAGGMPTPRHYTIKFAVLCPAQMTPRLTTCAVVLISWPQRCCNPSLLHGGDAVSRSRTCRKVSESSHERKPNVATNRFSQADILLVIWLCCQLDVKKSNLIQRETHAPLKRNTSFLHRKSKSPTSDEPGNV